MTTAFDLIAKALSGRVPPRVLVWGFLNTLNRSLKTGNRRFEFERLYLEHPDPWSYLTSGYERQKYEHVLAVALELRPGNKRALEVGCSVGVFSGMLAGHFERVTAIDVSKEALAVATRLNQGTKNICFIHQDLQTLEVDEQYDVIFCAEILYYIREQDVDLVCRKLDRHLSRQGIIVLVTGLPTGSADSFYFNEWENVFAIRFQPVRNETVENPIRPYRVAVFSQRA
jgi:2-polyprenyl-3-methyl-5-hydroxy-6-metoxy-1,4-benzoquinol methylase